MQSYYDRNSVTFAFVLYLVFCAQFTTAKIITTRQTTFACYSMTMRLFVNWHNKIQLY